MYRKITKSYLLAFTSLIIVSCSTAPKDHQYISPGEYDEIIENETRTDKKYSGLNNKYIINLTFLKSKVQTAQNRRLKGFLQWDDKKSNEHRQKLFKTMSEKTQFFVSFFTPEKELKNLHRGDSLWKFYLEIDGNKYPGKLSRKRKFKAQTKTLFPYHTRWSRGYMLNFDIPTLSTEEKSFKVIMTSSAGNSTFKF